MYEGYQTKRQPKAKGNRSLVENIYFLAEYVIIPCIISYIVLSYFKRELEKDRRFYKSYLNSTTEILVQF